MKTCIKCHTPKELDLFYKHKRSKDGHSSACKACSLEHCKSDRGRFVMAKTKARKRLIAWNLTFDEFKAIIKNPCHYCKNARGKPVRYAGGLDRLDNNIREYSISNAVSCCQPCNIDKHQLSPNHAATKIKNLIDNPSMKTCDKCHTLKDIAQFYKHRNKENHYSYCVDCYKLLRG